MIDDFACDVMIEWQKIVLERILQKQILWRNFAILFGTTLFYIFHTSFLHIFCTFLFIFFELYFLKRLSHEMDNFVKVCTFNQ